MSAPIPDRVVDAWMQIPTTEMLEDPMFDSLKRWIGSMVPGFDGKTVESPYHAGVVPAFVSTALAVMDASNIRMGIVCAWYGPNGPMISNDQVYSIIHRHPDRFAGLCGVDLRYPTKAVEELRFRVTEQGFKGLRLLPWLWDKPCNHRLYYPVLAECERLGVPFCLQVGHTGPLMPSEWGRPIPYLDDVAREFPNLKIVAGHIGYPWTTEMIALATKFKNVYIDTSAYTVKRYPPELVAYVRAHGKKKVLFGTNFPMIFPAKSLEALDSMELSEETTRLFLYENTERVFALDSPSLSPSRGRETRSKL